MAARVARRIFIAAVNRLDVTRGHRRAATSGKGGPVAVLHRPDEFFAAGSTPSLIGFGEAYLVGAWDAEDLGGSSTVLAAEMPTWCRGPLQRLRALYVARPPRSTATPRTNTRGNIAHHYDLSNDLFELFLDRDAELLQRPVRRRESPPRPRRPSTADRANLEPAPGPQDRAAAGPGRRHRGQRVLEIGIRLGRAGHPRGPPRRPGHHDHAVGEQQALARERIAAAAGDGDARVDVELCDYRAVRAPTTPCSRWR